VRLKLRGAWRGGRRARNGGSRGGKGGAGWRAARTARAGSEQQQHSMLSAQVTGAARDGSVRAMLDADTSMTTTPTTSAVFTKPPLSAVPDEATLLRTLRERFGFEHFRHGQVM
jgi:hypothetical protein